MAVIGTKTIVLISVCVIVILGVFSQPPISQPESYHDFADTKTILGIPNGMNVLSNILFLVGGIYGLIVLVWVKLTNRTFDRFNDKRHVFLYSVMFISMALVGVGSSYYHWYPTTTTLFWDRLPMTISFMSIVSILFTEKINSKMGPYLLWPLIAVGVFSVMHWLYTELHPELAGDMRLYIFVQIAPVCLTPLLISMYPDHFSHVKYMYSTTALYVAAKFAELFDKGIFCLTFHTISGHTLKHLLAGIGPFLLANMIIKRKIILF